MTNWPRRWKIEGDPTRWVGKTIVEAEVLDMQYGATTRQCVLLRFEDGSRGWSTAGQSNHIAVSPSLEAMKKSNIITPEEIAEVEADAHRRRQERAKEDQRMKRAQLEQLRKELSE